MINQDYVSIEIYNLLKEKGYNGEIKTCYNILNHPYTTVHLYDAMKWLREKHNLHIITIPYAPMDRNPYYHPGEADLVYIAQLFKGIIPIDDIGRSVIKLTYEQACEVTIKYCLENLVNNQ